MTFDEVGMDCVSALMRARLITIATMDSSSSSWATGSSDCSTILEGVDVLQS